MSGHAASELAKINAAMAERQKAHALPAETGTLPFWMLLDGLDGLDVERLRQELVDILADDRCGPSHIPGFLTFVRECVTAIDGTWIHDVVPTLAKGSTEDTHRRVERAVLEMGGSFHRALRTWLARSGRDRLYLEHGTYHWYVRAVAGETAKIKEAMGFLRGCLDRALAWSGSGDSAHAVADDIVEREWRRVMGDTGVAVRSELLHAALDGQRQSVCDQCTFAIELFRDLSGRRTSISTVDLDQALLEACEAHGIDPRQLLHRTKLSILEALGEILGPASSHHRDSEGSRLAGSISKYLLMDHGFQLSGDAQEMRVRLFGFALRTSVQGRADCRLVLETEVGSTSPHQEILWRGLVEGQVQVRFERMLMRRLGSSGVAVVRLLQNDGIELSHQTLRFPDPGVSLCGRLLPPGRWILPIGELALAATASQEPHVTGLDLRVIRRPDQGHTGLWHLLRGSHQSPMVVRLRGASGLREWRFESMVTGCSVGLSLDRGEGVHIYTDDEHGAPVVNGATARLRLTVTGDDGLVSDEVMTGILERISIGWRCDAKEGRSTNGALTHGRIVVDCDRKHMDIPLAEVLPEAGRGIRQCVFRIHGVAGSTGRNPEEDTSGGGDRFEVLEIPRCDIRLVPRRPGRSGVIEAVGQDGVVLFRLVEDGPSGTSGRPTADVVSLRGIMESRGIPLRAMAAVQNVGIWPHVPRWDAQTLLRNLTDDGTCVQAHGIAGTSVVLRMREAGSSGSSFLEERLDLGSEVDGDVALDALLPVDLADRPEWNRLLGSGLFSVEYDAGNGTFGRIDIDARSLPTGMFMISADVDAMTMRIRIDGHPGAPRAVVCRTCDRDGASQADIAMDFGVEGDRTAWLKTTSAVISRTVAIRIHRSTASVVLVEASSGDVLASMPVALAFPDSRHGLPDPPWSLDELVDVLGAVRRSPTPWSDRPLRSAVEEAMGKASDMRVRAFLHILSAWLWKQPKDVMSTDAHALSPSHLDAAATLWLDLAMDLRVPPDPGSWEQALRGSSTAHAARLLHAIAALRRGVDHPWNGGPPVDPPCRIRNRRLALIAGYLEQP